jgi:RecA/RadA recombinase
VQARDLGSGFRRMAFAAAKTETAILVLNQIRSAGEEAWETTAGGPAVKLYAAVRIAFEPMKTALGTRFRILKNRFPAQAREGRLRLPSPD